MVSTHTGSCLCGAVRFEITGDFDRFFMCHCSRCRKGSGSAHGANLFSATARLAWLAGADKVRTFHVAGTRHQRSFCTECGCGLPRQSADGRLLVVPAGSLDSDLALRPTSHIFVDDRAKWDEALETVPRAARYPG